MKNTLTNTALFYALSKHDQAWQEKVNRDRVGYHEARGNSSKKNFKRNQRKGL